MFFLRERLFSEIYVNDESVEVTFFREKIKSFKISDIKFILFNKNIICLMKEVPSEINKATIIKKIDNKNIIFQIPKDKIKLLLTKVKVPEVYIYSISTMDVLEEIKKYVDVKML